MDGDTVPPRSSAVQVDEDGAVALPEALRDALQLGTGDRVFIYPSLSGGLILRKVVEDDFTRTLEALQGVAGPGPTTDEMMEMTRGAPVP